MGKVSREFIPATRTINGMFIMFCTKETIYVEEMHTGIKVCFHRWFDKNAGFYTECWSKFSHDLKYSNTLTLYKIYVLSAKYGIAHILTKEIPDIPKGARIIPKRSKNK